jgi:phosphoribosylformylglycinamidine cyclo-ligase
MTDTTGSSSTYSKAGVDIDAGDLAVQLMKEHLKRARRAEVIGDIGGFAGLFDVSALKRFSRTTRLVKILSRWLLMILLFVAPSHFS